MNGKILFGAAGTGLNFPNFPPGKEIVAVDLSEHMLARARSRADWYEGTISLQVADLQHLPFPEGSFDTAATASTVCSVSNPLQVLWELHRVLKPGGKLLLFEHVRSRNPILGAELDFMNLAFGFLGPAMNRDTLSYVHQAGFVIDSVVCVYFDIFLAIEAHKPSSAIMPRSTAEPSVGRIDAALPDLTEPNSAARAENPSQLGQRRGPIE